MRNLKKILAMVLALVMSLSLMATAGAADFPDVKDDTSYKTAIDVLSGLGVFNGYKEDGTFRPDGEITRAETAAIIYRIVTGDVKDEQVKIYSDYGLFKDVPANSWFAGYVNFCANAEYIKGDGKGNFNPNDKVEGYAALAMILRAIGYTANGGFTGSDWRVQTARVGEARKITKNITSGTLGSNADRKTVAEILYQAIMVDMVDHNVDNTFNGDQGYTTVPLTLGQKTFGLEYVSGVILANEWANLVGDEVLAADTTKMQITTTYATQSKIAKDATLTLNDKTELEMQEALDAVGLTYDAHIANPTATTADVITLDKSDINVVAYNEGKGVYKAAEHNNYNNATWATIEKLAEEEGLKLGTGAETEYFVNYEERWDANCTSDYRISYAIAKDSLLTGSGLPSVQDKTAWQNYIDELKTLTNNGAIPTPASSKYAGHYLGERTIKLDLNLDGTAETSVECWVVAIIPEATINQIDLDIMREIFYTADRVGNNGGTADWLRNYAVGEVYVGTTSMQDYSDTMSWKEFCDKYFVDDVNSRRFEQCEIGNSLRVIDNNGDGVAEYVLRIDYTQDKIVGTFKNQLAGYAVAIGNFEGNLLYNPDADKIEQGTVINYVEIDKKLYVWPAPVVTDSITNKNFQKITVTTASGDEYNQSGIKNETRMDENIMLMNQNTPYNMYMDVYGVNIRSYELAQGSKYALLTEMYPTKDSNASYVQNIGAIAEVKIGEADVKEYPVVLNTNNNTLNPFFSRYIWTWGARAHSGADTWTWNTPGVTVPQSWLYNANYLQPAVAHLNIPAITGGNPSHVTSPAVNAGVTDNEVDVYYTPNRNANGGWWRYTAEAQVNPNWANGNGSEIGVFDYDLTAAVQPVTDTSDTNAEFSFTNVATYVDNDGTLTLGTASKLAANRANGAQLYRVSEDAAKAVPAFAANATAENKAMVTLWGHGTEAQLVAAYNQATGTDGGQAWFNTYTSVPYQNGKGIYPIYETDYVQLDLTKGDRGEVLASTDLVVKPGIRHFHINDIYSQYYNANSNEYVDATIDTEFYIVLPGTTANTIMYKVGYADLPNIEVNKIRAAYAVATNTSHDSNSRDYWVADVVVIEVTELTHDYDSIGLVYYNPFVQDGYTRYADTLNNMWRNLQPDYDGKAKMGITPKGGFTDINWGDASWSIGNEDNYKFWKLYQTELTAPGQLAVTKAAAIDEDYNAYGIYAGAVERVERLQTSSYIDVTTKDTGSVQTYAIDTATANAGEVPFYTISGSAAAYGRIYTANQINLSNTLRYSDVKNGDKLIWVYEKATKQIAFVIDLDSRADGYNQPAWLLNLYNDILVDQNSGTAGAFDAEKLLADAKAVDEKADATAQEVNDMIARMEAAKDKTMTVEQASRYSTLLASLKAKALPLNKNAALLAAQELANEILLNGSASSNIKTPVSTALGTLTAAINSASNATALELIWKNGEFVPTQADVKGLKDAIALANAQISAIAVAAKAVTDAGLTVADAGISTAYTALVSKIEACSKITQTPPAALTTTDVEYYVKDGKLTNVAESAALATAIATAAGTAAMTKAVADAKAAADKVAAGCETLVAAELTALKTAIDTYANSAVTAAEKLALLNAIAADNWNAAVGTALWAPYQDLLQAVADKKAEAEKNEAIDKEVVPDQIGDNADLPVGGMSYPASYAKAGVTVTPNATGAAISIDSTTFSAFLKNENGEYTAALTTMRPHNASGPIDAAALIAAGVSFKAPAGATQVKVYKSTTPLTPVQIAGLGTSTSWTSTIIQGGGSDFRPNGELNIWTSIATGTDDPTVSGYELKNLSYVGNKTVYVYMQFTDGTNNIGSVITREITVSMS